MSSADPASGDRAGAGRERPARLQALAGQSRLHPAASRRAQQDGHEWEPALGSALDPKRKGGRRAQGAPETLPRPSPAPLQLGEPHTRLPAPGPASSAPGYPLCRRPARPCGEGVPTNAAAAGWDQLWCLICLSWTAFIRHVSCSVPHGVCVPVPPLYFCKHTFCFPFGKLHFIFVLKDH